MSDWIIPDTPEELLRLCDQVTEVRVTLECAECGAVWNLLLPAMPEPRPAVRCERHGEGDL